MTNISDNQQSKARNKSIHLSDNFMSYSENTEFKGGLFRNASILIFGTVAAAILTGIGYCLINYAVPAYLEGRLEFRGLFYGIGGTIFVIAFIIKVVARYLLEKRRFQKELAELDAKAGIS